MKDIKVHITKNWMQNILSRMLDFGQTEFDAALREKPDGSIVLSVQIAGDRILPLYMGAEPVAVLKVGGKFVPDPDAELRERIKKEGAELAKRLEAESAEFESRKAANEAPAVLATPASPVAPAQAPAPKPAQPKAVEQKAVEPKKKKATEGEE